MSGYTKANNNSSQDIVTSPNHQYLSDLNTFFNRFDCPDFTIEMSDLKSELLSPPLSQDVGFTNSEDEVRSQFNNLATSKAPDGIPSRVLKACSDNLA